MGLLLLKEFVEANKGEISAESKLNEGIMFWFKVPIPLDEPLSKN